MLNDVCHDVLFELGTEELPSGSVKPLACALWDAVNVALEQQGLAVATHDKQHEAGIPCFATPRRLAIRFQVKTKQAEQTITRRGPAYAVGMSADGVPSQALLGFAHSCGVDVTELDVMETEKGRWWMYHSTRPGRLARELLPEILQHAVASLPIAKPMRWGHGDTAFVRPVHWAVLLFDHDVIDMGILGCRTTRLSVGHRFHHPDSVVIESPQHYEHALEDAHVVVDFHRRRERIRQLISECAQTVHGKVHFEPDLLDEVTSIVEWPVPLLARFDASFLHDVPAEALVAAMHVHQKCFPVYDANHGELLPYFITVSNIQSTHPARVVVGNERVMHARLSDAAFFYRQDRKRALSDYVPLTSQVVFQEKLGSLHDKAMRVKALMVSLSSWLNLNQDYACRAASLSKADLMTAMVGEFPELEGVMGYYYAKHDGEVEAVALALKEYYMPRFAADSLPTTLLGQALSLADRLDTLTGAFVLDLKPTGTKDPFKLRRHALAVIRLLKTMTTEPPLLLSTLLSHALEGYRQQHAIAEHVLHELKQFILDRLPASYQDTAIGSDLILAVRACQDECLFDFEQRVMALDVFRHRFEAAALTSACKRVDHLLMHCTEQALQVDVSCFVEVEETRLWQAMVDLEAQEKANKHGVNVPTQNEYTQFLTALAGLREPIDAFFEHVMVMTDNIDLQRNRLAMLQHLQNLLQKVAKISLMK